MRETLRCGSSRNGRKMHGGDGETKGRDISRHQRMARSRDVGAVRRAQRRSLVERRVPAVLPAVVIGRACESPSQVIGMAARRWNGL